MKKTLFTALAWVLLAGAAVILPLTSAHAETFAIETETRIYDPVKSYGGYFMPSQSYGGAQDNDSITSVYLMNMMGEVVHVWEKVKGTPQLLPDGRLFAQGMYMDWNGNVQWEYNPGRDSNRPDLTPSHDARRIWNKKLQQWTMICHADNNITQAQAVAAGADPSVNYASPTNRLTRYPGTIEVDMNKNIVWEWRFIDHTCQSQNPAWPNYVSDVKLAPGKLDVNWKTNGVGPAGIAGLASSWVYTNSIDYNEDLDHIMINGKHWGSFFVVDHGKTFVSTTDWAANRAAAKGPDGDIIYRFGNPSNYNQGLAPGFQNNGDQQTYGQHNIQWIRPYHWERPHLATDKWPDPAALYGTKSVALPGAGHMMVFDNACWSPTGSFSKVLEINPYLNAQGVDTGKYVNPPDAGYTRASGGNSYTINVSKQVVWRYMSNLAGAFYSRYISGMQRLPNGNTSINSGESGHMFEVTPAGEVVWEYQWPGLPGPNALTVMWDKHAVNPAGGLSLYYMFRHYRYGADYPGLVGKDLTPIATITGKAPQVVGSGITYPQPVTYTGFGYAPGGSSGGSGGGLGAGAGGTGY